MTDIVLTSNFLHNARGLTFHDGGGVTWSFDPATNRLTATAAGGAGVGTVTSVALADGSTTALYAITGSPVAASGTLTFTLKTQNANLVLAGPGTGVAAQPGFRALVVNDLPTGYPYSELTGTPAIPAAANPTTKVALAVANGTAATFMRSDAAPALDVTITPTWTGAHVFTPTAGVAITINALTGSLGLSATGVADQYAAQFVGVNTTGHSRGVRIQAGTNASDLPFVIANASGGANLLVVAGDGSATISGGAWNFGSGIQINSGIALTTLTSGTFTPVIAGSTTAGTATYSVQHGTYQQIGKFVLYNVRVDWTVHTGTGNMTLTGLPVAANNTFHSASVIYDNGITAFASAQALINAGTTKMSFTTNSGSGSIAMAATGSFLISGVYETN